MIAHVFEERCSGCNSCADVCPTLVFEPGERAPVIARPDACQTCYMCELYCPADALYVAPEQSPPSAIDPAAILASGQLGRVRRDQGWTTPERPDILDVYWQLGPLLQQGARHAEKRHAEKRQADRQTP